MIGFILGTSEGKKILSLINQYTDDVVVSTATSYGGELLKEYKTKYINTKPLDENGFKDLINDFNITVLVDGSHPYAKEVSNNAIKVCKAMNIDYIRYERKSYFSDIEEGIIKIDKYEELEEVLKNIDGNILNTTGSNNVSLISNLNISNRIIHRIMPYPEIIRKLLDIGVNMEDIIAIKGPFGYELNEGIIKEYNIKAIITKDSGIEGGTKEKVEAALNNNAKVIVVNRPKINYGKIFDDIEEMIKYIVVQVI